MSTPPSTATDDDPEADPQAPALFADHTTEYPTAPPGPNHTLGDFLTSPRLILIALLATVIGVASAFVALVLLRLIGLFTNLFFFQRWDTALTSPAGNTLGLFEILVPAFGALLIGLMARYGSEKIRGHGIPEAIEAILINGSRVEPKVAILKPLSSAISIGSGGTFGAEGPIIMTCGAVGSMVAQFLHLTGAERKTLLVAGAAGGMSATFGTPVAAVLLAVELLLFEWRPRSLIPVALASAAAAAVRPLLIGAAPLFPTPPHAASLGLLALLACVLAGLLAGGLSAILTQAVYAAEDTFGRLPIHWMWWPVLGGLVVGLGGLAFPEALGVGYDMLGDLLQGDVSGSIILGILVVKSLIWAISLGSGTSGGVLAPLLMMGGALGGLESLVFPDMGVGFWPLISMGAILGGTMRSPFTGIVFALELTHDVNSLLPLLVAVPTAYLFTVLTMKRSILTEKISRRGLHLSREYAVDPLETTFVREVMRTSLVVFSARLQVAALASSLRAEHHGRHQRLYPVIDDADVLVGVVTSDDLDQVAQTSQQPDDEATISTLMQANPVVAYPNETLRMIVYRMAETGRTRLPVVDRTTRQLIGMISIQNLLHARARNLREERQRERVLRLRRLWPRRHPAPVGASGLGAEPLG
jgi:H+/Cl- antiporter ClcA/CBS domain-containing protein